MERGIAIYSRKSKFTGKGESIGNQVELCREYIRNLFGPEAAEDAVIFEDEGFSGGDLKRPAFRDMMTQARKGRFSMIAVYRLDRISRNIGDFAGLVQELNRLRVAFVSIREQFDTGTPIGRAMMYIISVFSQLERETIAERIRDNMHELAKTGRWLGGNTPTGYGSESVSQVTLDGKRRKACRLRLIPEEAQLVRRIFDLYLQCDSLTGVEKELLYRGIKTKQGKDFSRFSIKAILQNPVYMVADSDARAFFEDRNAGLFSPPEAFDGSCGIMAYNRTDQEKGKATAYLPMEQWIVAVGKHPGIIPSSQWIRVFMSLERNKSAAYRKPRRNEALLTGKLFCACGGRMYPKLSGRKTPEGGDAFSYVCKEKARSSKSQCSCPNLNGNAMDGALLETLKVLPWHRQTFLAGLEKIRRENLENDSAEDRDFREQLTQNQRKIGALIDAMSLVEAPEARRRIAAKISQLTRENEAIKQRTAPENSTPPWAAMALAQWPQSLEKMSLEEKRNAVCSLVERVVWDGSVARTVMKTGATKAL